MAHLILVLIAKPALELLSAQDAMNGMYCRSELKHCVEEAATDLGLKTRRKQCNLVARAQLGIRRLGSVQTLPLLCCVTLSSLPLCAVPIFIMEILT